MRFVQAPQEKEKELREIFLQSFTQLGNVERCSVLERETHANDDAVVETSNGVFFVTNNTWGALFRIPTEHYKPLQEAVVGWSEALRRKGLPTPAIVRNDQGQTVTQYDEKIITVEEYVGALPVAIDRGFKATKKDIKAGARLLAHYHTLAEELKEVPAAQQLRKLATWGPVFSALTEEYFSQVRPKLIDQALPPGIAKEIDYTATQELFARVDELDMLTERYRTTADQNGLSDGTYINHMDLHPDNVLWTPKKPHAIDIDGVRPQRSWAKDIAFSATRFGQFAVKKGKEPVEVTQLFLQEYRTATGTSFALDQVIEEAGGIEAAKVFNILNRAYRGGGFTYFQNVTARHLPTALAPQTLFER